MNEHHERALKHADGHSLKTSRATANTDAQSTVHESDQRKVEETRRGAIVQGQMVQNGKPTDAHAAHRHDPLTGGHMLEPTMAPDSLNSSAHHGLYRSGSCQHVGEQPVQGIVDAIRQGDAGGTASLSQWLVAHGSERSLDAEPVSAMLHRVADAAQHGHYWQAAEILRWLSQLYPNWQWLVDLRAACLAQAAQAREQLGQLYQAAAKGMWREVLRCSEQVLKLMPHHVVAAKLRQLAFANVHNSGGVPTSENVVLQSDIEALNVPPRHVAPRYLLWVDGSGVYFVFTGEHVVIGQPTMAGENRLAVQGDVAAHHAIFHRNRLGYWLEALSATSVNGRPPVGCQRLATGDVVTFGGSVTVAYRQPHSLSATACLRCISGHRTVPPSDGTILLADSCVLGRKPSSHIACRHWQHEVVLYYTAGRLWCCASEPFQVDGLWTSVPLEVSKGARIHGATWGLSLEVA